VSAPAVVYVAAWGAVTPVGLSAVESAFGFRASVNSLRESAIANAEGTVITMGLVPTLAPTLEGIPRLLALADLALADLLRSAQPLLSGKSLRLAVVLDPAPHASWDASREVGDHVRARLGSVLGVTLHAAVSTNGSAGFIEALHGIARARDDGHDALTIVLAVHSDHCLKRTDQLAQLGRIWGEDCLDAVLLGEGAVALLVTAREPRHLGCPLGVRVELSELTREAACPDNDESAFLAAGMTVAARAVTESRAGRTEKIGWISSDVSYETFRVSELSTVLTRLQSRLGPPQVLDAPNQRLGSLGAALAAFQISYAGEAFARDFAPAPECLCLLGTDEGVRAAMVLGPERAS
jgi:3-oxoacyl-[acyl-carrier-protein] synthase-1